MKEIVLDEFNRVITTSGGFSSDASPADVFDNMRALVKEFLAVFQETRDNKPVSILQIIELESNKEDIVELLGTYRVNTIKEGGCLRFDVVEDEQNENTLYTYRVFENLPAFMEHKA